jgi:hypothetical protein
MVAIDFTASNGDPSMPISLHHIDSSGLGRLNEYQQAIAEVGRVIEQYDTDKMFAVFGFGARVRLPNGQYSAVQHCFPIYGGAVEVRGVDGVLRVQHSAAALACCELNLILFFSCLLSGLCRWVTQCAALRTYVILSGDSVCGGNCCQF